jgi:hypothetical protein
MLPWDELLKRWSRAALASPQRTARLPKNVIASGWLGYPGASPAALQQAEARLGISLSPSYRQFLATTNGWHTGNRAIPELWPVEQIEWFRVNNQRWIDAYFEADIGPVSDSDYFTYGKSQDPALFRREYLESALQISPEGDEAVLLLNPKVTTPDGEWEAWFFANWLPGAARYRSFRELMAEDGPFASSGLQVDG